MARRRSPDRRRSARAPGRNCSAALAFYAILALFPALIALVTVYGLVSDPQQVEQQLAGLSRGLGGGAGQLLRG